MLICLEIKTYWAPVNLTYFLQKQPLRGVSRKRCSENMQQIYRRIPMPKCYFSPVPKFLCCRALSKAWKKLEQASR